jgi:hypothetical protein
MMRDLMFIGPWRTTRSRSSFLLREMELLWEVEFQWNTGKAEVEDKAMAEGGVLEELVEELSMLALCCTIKSSRELVDILTL